MKIAVLHNFYRRTIPSGENVAVMSQIDALREAGHEVKLFSTESDDLNPSLFQLLKVASVVAFHTPDGMGLAEEINRFGADVVHIHNLFPRISEKTLEQLKIPIVVTLHNYRTLCAAGTLSRDGKDCFACLEINSFAALQKPCYRQSLAATIPLAFASRQRGKSRPIFRVAAGTIVLSHHAWDIFSESVPEPEKLHLLPNFSPEFCLPNNPTRESWVFIGRLTSEKGIVELVQSWPDGHSLKVYGTGELEDQIVRFIEQSEWIEYKGGLEPHQVPDVLTSAKGLVFPSTCKENSPMIYLEALSAGTPVIAYGENVVGTQLQIDQCGVTFKHWADLSLAIREVEDNWSTMSELALHLTKSKYSKSSWLLQIERIYEAAIYSARNSANNY